MSAPNHREVVLISAPDHRNALHTAADVVRSEEHDEHLVNLARAYLELRREAEKRGWTPKDGE